MDYIAEIADWIGEDEDCTICVETYRPGVGSAYSAVSDIDYFGELEYIVKDSNGNEITDLSDSDRRRFAETIEQYFLDQHD